MLCVALLLLKIIAVIFAPTMDPIMTDVGNKTDSSLDAALSLQLQTPPPPKRLVSSELTSFTSNVKQRVAHNETVAGTVVHGTFPCVWQNYNGSLVTGDRAVVFSGSFFLFEKTLILPWDDIRRVELVDNTDLDLAKRISSINGIIEIVVNDDSVHSFFNVRSPEKVWLLLLTLHNDALLGRKASSTNVPRTPRMQRRNSDPSAALSGSLFVAFASENDFTTGQQPTNFNRPVVSTSTSMAESVTKSTIESATGRLKLQPIPCTHIGVTGRLYAGQSAVYFTGKRYFWEHVSVTLPWSTIRHILAMDKAQEGSIMSGIVIHTKESALRTDGGSVDDDETTFEFRNMDTPEKVWASLIALQNECLRSSPVAAAPTPADPTSVVPPSLPPPPPSDGASARNRRKSLRRMNSDPRTSSQVNFHYDEDGATTTKSPTASPLKAGVLLLDTPTAETKSGSSQSVGEAWAAMAGRSEKEAYDNVVINGHVLTNCDLERFFDLFVSDNAKCALGRFLESRGDFEVQSTLWEDGDTSDTDQNTMVPRQKRVVRYMHPVNAPLAPPQARARKEQVVYKFGSSGILIETQTFVDDVPMTDCFYVADRIRIEPFGAGATDVSLTMEFGITFVKSTMFKGIISRKTSSEFSLLFKALAQYMSDALVDTVDKLATTLEVGGPDDSSPVPQVAEPLQDRGPPSPTQPLSTPPLIWHVWTPERILLAILLLLQLWILYELRIMRLSQSTINGQCSLTDTDDS
jgi:VAD1 Analog of StAR-related lipid transfer domain